jgi:hypothetical protein
MSVVAVSSLSQTSVLERLFLFLTPRREGGRNEGRRGGGGGGGRGPS